MQQYTLSDIRKRSWNLVRFGANRPRMSKKKFGNSLLSGPEVESLNSTRGVCGILWNEHRPKLFAQHSRPSDRHTGLRIQQMAYTNWGETWEHNVSTWTGGASSWPSAPVYCGGCWGNPACRGGCENGASNPPLMSFPIFGFASWISVLNFLQNPLVHFLFLLPPSSTTPSEREGGREGVGEGGRESNFKSGRCPISETEKKKGKKRPAQIPPLRTGQNPWNSYGARRLRG